MISGANIMTKNKKRSKSEEKTKQGRSNNQCEYDKIKGCEASRSNSPLMGYNMVELKEQSMYQIDVMISNELLLIKLIPVISQCQRNALLALHNLIFSQIAIFPGIYLKVSTSIISWINIHFFPPTIPK